MTTISGNVDEETKEQIDELVEKGQYDSISEFVEFSARYTIHGKHRN